LLGQVYDAFGLDRPTFVSIPIVPQAVVEPTYGISDLVTIEIDDNTAADWGKGGHYDFVVPGVDSVDAVPANLIGSFDYAFDKENMFIRVDFEADVVRSDSFDLYLDIPNSQREYGLSDGGTVLGFQATHRLSWSGSEPRIVNGPIVHSVLDEDESVSAVAGFDGRAIEFALPIESLPAIEAGDRISFRLIETDRDADLLSLPLAGPGYIQVPDIDNV
ncbi:MAG: hypothetical protein GY708_21010, partial [Actinomycetia bacterium]|nr:hypothetical protein [Actinomycetes bacterium]